MFMLFQLAAAQTTTGGAAPATNGQLFRPSIDASHTLWVNDSGKAPDTYFTAHAVGHYTRNPVVFVRDNGDVTRIVGDLFQLSLTAGYTKGPIRFGVDVPVFLRNLGSLGGETGIGDIALDVKGTVLDRSERALGLAFAGRASLPTSTVDASLGNQGFGWEVEGIVDKDIGNLLIAANMGMRGVPRRELQTFRWGEQVIGRLGGGYAFTEHAGVSLDFAALLNLNDPVPEAIPVEGIIGGWGGFDSLVVRGGVGTGLTGGFGAPALRVILSVGYEPPRTRDTDEDGIEDRVDVCPEEKEDPDGFRDEDGCPEPTSLLVRITDLSGAPIPGAAFTLYADNEIQGGDGTAVPLFGGRYQIDVRAEGYVPVEGQKVDVPDQERAEVSYQLQKVVTAGTLKVSVTDGSLQPIPGARWTVLKGPEGDIAPGGTAKVEAGAYEVRADAEGYRPVTREVTITAGELAELSIVLPEAKVQVTAERIEIKESIFFETGKAVIKPESFPLLEEVAGILQDHAELTKIRIEGHTDSRGDNASNLKLSKERAASVRTFLINRGVAEARLESEGYGETRPIAKGANEDAWSKNRRVDFFVAERKEE